MRQDDTVDMGIIKEEMMDRYKKWRETTTTSPSGRHLGHFHALFRSFKSDNED